MIEEKNGKIVREISGSINAVQFKSFPQQALHYDTQYNIRTELPITFQIKKQKKIYCARQWPVRLAYDLILRREAGKLDSIDFQSRSTPFARLYSFRFACLRWS